ncbi:lamin tail domain-containing protein [Corynebacterium doosanense]|uniref:LTD domain-containing protein n=1 Tax=Corynebacterium doosanense CAU 212 = DSM 45436 TaxID=558173 RepID=A0A097IHL5_9CORY|nr:lamin tail domain-containing protein [Corynebacterium doosanense]AIT61615.1 hypothetical protein CDOO_10310 [Corynebacterium doosanense CAU 212 = DSM 45436]
MSRIARALPLGVALITAATLATPIASAAPAGVVINEVSPDQEWVEIANPGTSDVDVSGWTLIDDKADRTPVKLAANTILRPGERLQIYVEGATVTPDGSKGFGLGKADEITLSDTSATKVDSYKWTENPGTTSYGRVPDFTGDFVVTAAATPGAPNGEAAPPPEDPTYVDSPVVINEVESNGDAVGDWVELANTDTINSIDISGWTITDNDAARTPLTIPAGTSIESGGYASFYTDKVEGGFGLGGNDSVIVRNADGAIVAETTWDGHALTSWGRVPDKTGDFAVTGAPTRNAPNTASGTVDPVADKPWPYDPQEITNLALGSDFNTDDMSGIDVDSHGRAWIVNNGNGTLHALDYDQATKTWETSGKWTLAYPGGEAGAPDAEGITIGEDGALYVATERSGAANSISRPSVLRFELPKSGDTTLTATHEWNLAETIGAVSANGGLEAVEYVGGGVYAVGVEATGNVHFVTLKRDGSHALVQTLASGFPGVMALDFAGNKLRILCDEACEGASVIAEKTGGTWAVTSEKQARPAGMGNFANEGFASFTSDGMTQFLWADDANTEGTSVRYAETTKAPTEDNGLSSGSSFGPFAALVAAVGAVAALAFFGLNAAGLLPADLNAMIEQARAMLS